MGHIKNKLKDKLGLGGEYSLMVLAIYYYSHLMGKVDALRYKVEQHIKSFII